MSTTLPADSERTGLDPAWKDWGSMLALALLALLLPYGCGPQAPPSGLHKHLIGRWEKEDDRNIVLIFTDKGDLIYPDGRSEKLAQELDGWKAEFGIGQFDVTVTKGSKVVGSFDVDVRTDDEMQITRGEGLKSKDLRGVYRRFAGSGAESIAQTPGGENSLAAKLPPLKKALADLKRQEEKLQTARVEFEKQRVALLPKLRAEGFAAETPPAELSPKARVLRDEFLDVSKQMKAAKGKLDDLKTTIAKTESLINQVERRILLENLDASPESVEQLREADILIADVKDRISDGGTHDSLLNDLEAAKLLEEQFQAAQQDK